MDVYDRVMEVIQGYQYVIHKDDKETENLEGDGICIEVINDSNPESNMFIDKEWDYYTLAFGCHHDHFDTEDDENEADYLIRWITQILHNERCSVSLHYYDHGELKCYGSRFITDQSAKEDSVEEVFGRVFIETDFKKLLEQNGGEVRYLYWNASQNKVLRYPQKQ